jgi:hypothetical protein
VKHLLIILISILLSSPLFGESKKAGVLYRWEIDKKVYVWKNFGDEDINPKYKGEIKDKKPNGLGITIFPDGSKYEGLYKNGERHGRGKISGRIKLYSKGEWKNGYYWNMITYDFDGKVRDKYENGLLKYGVLFTYKENDIRIWTGDDEKKDGKYVGEVKNRKPNGKGLVKYKDGNELNGKWKNGFFNDNGTLIYPDGRKYVGRFENGIWNGQGILTYPDGRKYVGRFENGKPQGQGALTHRIGRKYVGEFKNGKPHGQGILIYSDGRKSIGRYRLDKPWDVVDYDKNGVIIRKRVNGLIKFDVIYYGGGGGYVGEIDDSVPNGQGIFNYPNGMKYVGGWKNGKRNGQGIMTTLDGKKYVGGWKEGEKNYQGTETTPNVGKYEGGWRNGKTNGQGTLTFPNGSNYVGEFKDDKRWNGTYYDKYGNITKRVVNGKIETESFKDIKSKKKEILRLDLREFSEKRSYKIGIRIISGNTFAKPNTSNNSLSLIWENYGLGFNQMSFNDISSTNDEIEMENSSIDLSYKIGKEWILIAGTGYVYGGKGSITSGSSAINYETESISGFGLFGLFGKIWENIEGLIGLRYYNVNYTDFKSTNRSDIFSLSKPFSIVSAHLILGLGYSF